MSWGKFQRLFKEVGYKRPVKAGSVQLLDPEIAEAVVLQKMNRDVKSPNCAPIYAAIPKRFDTNLTCI